MNLESFSALDEEIKKEDWERTPACVKRLLAFLLNDFLERLRALEEEQVWSAIERDESNDDQSEEEAETQNTPEQELHCSFCWKKESEVLKMMASLGACICNECVEICNQIIEDDQITSEKLASAGKQLSTEASFE